MSYTIKRLTEPRCIHSIMPTDFDMEQDLEAFYHDLWNLLEAESEPIPAILDISDISVTIENLLKTSRDVPRYDVNPTQHPMLSMNIIITDSSLMKMSVDGFRKFGILKTVYLVKTLDEAFEIVKREHRNSA